MADIQGKIAQLTLEDADTLSTLCHALSSPVRVYIMRLLERRSMSIGEIAEALELSVNTVSSRLQRGRELLKKMLKEE